MSLPLRSPLLRRLRAFTVLEMLVVVVVVGILVGLALIQFGSVQERSYLATMKSDLRNFATARAIHISEHSELPARYVDVESHQFSPQVYDVAYQSVDISDWELTVGHILTSTQCTIAESGAGGATRIACDTEPAPQFEAAVNGMDVEYDASGAIASASFAPENESPLAALAALAAVPNPVVTIMWDFGDGNSVQGSPSAYTRLTHRYATGGTYLARLTLIREDGTQREAAHRVQVGSVRTGLGNQFPVAQISVPASSLVNDVPIVFDGSGSHDRDGTIVKYEWSIGGSTGSSSKKTYWFANPGTYEVHLTVYDNHGAIGRTTLTVEIRAAVAGSYLPRSVQGLSGFGCALYQADLYCWGRDGNFGNPAVSSSTTPRRAAPSIAIRSFSLGGTSNCAIATDGKTYCWGYNKTWQVGDGTTNFRSTPVPIVDDPGLVSLAHAGSSVCGLTAAGKAYCWGFATGPEKSGSPSTAERPIPLVGGLTFQSIDAGGGTYCGVTTSNDGYCWGWGGDGMFGDGGGEELRSDPQPVWGGIKWKQIVVGGYNVCGLATSGETLCWGDASGALGYEPTSPDILVPTQITDDPGFEQLIVGNGYSCGRKADGQLFCWGFNGWGQFGNGTEGSRHSTPTLGAGGMLFSHVVAGAYQVCGDRLSDGALYCWGRQMDHDTGTGAAGNKLLVPTPVPNP